MSKPYSIFRNWVHNLWLDNCEEHDQDKRPKYSEKEYFQMYKYWIKREFKHQQKVNNGTKT
jgi:hypothetical protein